MSGRSVGRRSAGRRSDHRSRHTTAKPRATPKPTRPSRPCRSRPASSWRGRARNRSESVSVHVPANDPSRTPSGKPRLALRARLPAGRQRATHRSTPMTTPVTVSQDTHSRRQNIPARAGHRRRARRSPGRSPGTTDFASRPGFPHDLGWGPLQNGRESDSGGPVVRTGRSVGRCPDSRQREPRHDGRVSRVAPGAQDGRYGANAIAAAAIAVVPGARARVQALPSRTPRILTRTAVGRTPGPQRSRRRATALRRRPAPRADRRSDARVPCRAPHGAQLL